MINHLGIINFVILILSYLEQPLALGWCVCLAAFFFFWGLGCHCWVCGLGCRPVAFFCRRLGGLCGVVGSKRRFRWAWVRFGKLLCVFFLGLWMGDLNWFYPVILIISCRHISSYYYSSILLYKIYRDFHRYLLD